MPFVELVATLVGPALQVWLAAAMIRRKLHRQFPLFFAYTLYSVAMTAARIAGLLNNRALMD